MTTATMILLAVGLGLGCWVLAKVGHYVTKFLEAIAAIVAVFVFLWLAVKGTYMAGRWIVLSLSPDAGHVT